MHNDAYDASPAFHESDNEDDDYDDLPELLDVPLIDSEYESDYDSDDSSTDGNDISSSSKSSSDETMMQKRLIDRGTSDSMILILDTLETMDGNVVEEIQDTWLKRDQPLIPMVFSIIEAASHVEATVPKRASKEAHCQRDYLSIPGYFSTTSKYYFGSNEASVDKVSLFEMHHGWFINRLLIRTLQYISLLTTFDIEVILTIIFLL